MSRPVLEPVYEEVPSFEGFEPLGVDSIVAYVLETVPEAAREPLGDGPAADQISCEEVRRRGAWLSVCCFDGWGWRGAR